MISIEEKAVQILSESMTLLHGDEFEIAHAAAIATLVKVWPAFAESDYSYVSSKDCYNEYLHLTQENPGVGYRSVFGHESKL